MIARARNTPNRFAPSWMAEKPNSLRIRHLDHQLTEVFAAEKLEQRFRESFESFHNVFFGFQFALGAPRGQIAHAFRVARGKVKHQKTFHAGAVDEQRKIIRWALNA